MARRSSLTGVCGSEIFKLNCYYYNVCVNINNKEIISS